MNRLEVRNDYSSNLKPVVPVVGSSNPYGKITYEDITGTSSIESISKEKLGAFIKTLLQERLITSELSILRSFIWDLPRKELVSSEQLVSRNILLLMGGLILGTSLDYLYPPKISDFISRDQNASEIRSIEKETPEALAIDDSRERTDLLRSIGITELPERESKAFEELKGFLDDLIEGEFDATKSIKELRRSKD